MEAYINLTTDAGEKFLNDKLIENRRRFFEEFLDQDEGTKYIIIGLGDDIILSLYQLETLIHTSEVRFEIVSDECVIGMLNDIPFIIEYL